MGECIIQALAEDEKRGLHRRAASLYAADLSKNQSDPAALDLLPYHLHEAGDEEAFLEAVDRVGPEKYRLRLLRSFLRDLREALAIYRRLAQQEAAAFEPEVATTLNNLGTVLGQLGDRAGGKQACEQALAISRRLAKDQPAAFEPRVAAILNNVGNMLANLGDRAEAKQAYDEALAVYRRLAESEPAAFEPHVARTLNNLGNVLSDLGDRAGAKQAFEEALGIYRRLAEAEPAAFLDDLLVFARNARGLLEQMGDDLSSWPNLRAALELTALLGATGEE